MRLITVLYHWFKMRFCYMSPILLLAAKSWSSFKSITLSDNDVDFPYLIYMWNSSRGCSKQNHEPVVNE